MNHQKVSVGTAYLVVAQGIFLVSGYVIHIVLGRTLGPAEYGLFGVVLYVATIFRILVGSGLPMAVSRYISAEPDRAEGILRKGLSLQLAFSALISLSFFFLAPSLACFLGDGKLISLLRIVSPISLFYGVFFLFIQYYNGLRRYTPQSVWLAIYYLLRAGLIIVPTLMGMRILGAVTGLFSATVIAAFFIFVSRKPEKKNQFFPASPLIFFSYPLIIGSMAEALITDLDLMFVKKLMPDALSVGHYTSAKALARTGLFLFYAYAGALFPAVSNAYSVKDFAKLKQFIRQANQLLMMVSLPLIILVSYNSTEIITLFYGASYIEGAPALSWLVFSFSILSVFIIHKTIITACGYSKISSIFTLLLLPVCIGLNITLIPHFGLVGGAVSSGITYIIGVCCSASFIYSKFRAGINPSSILRIAGAASLMVVLDVVLTWSGLALILKLVFLIVFYLIALGVLGELRRDQLREFVEHFKMGGRKKTNGTN